MIQKNIDNNKKVDKYTQYILINIIQMSQTIIIDTNENNYKKEN